jgi:hypothetical protein
MLIVTIDLGDVKFSCRLTEMAHGPSLYGHARRDRYTNGCRTGAAATDARQACPLWRLPLRAIRLTPPAVTRARPDTLLPPISGLPTIAVVSSYALVEAERALEG